MPRSTSTASRCAQQQLAELVVSGQAEHGWFDDAVTLAPDHAPPLSEDEAGRLREVRRKLGKDLVYVQARVPAADDLLPPAEVAQLHDVLVRMHESCLVTPPQEEMEPGQSTGLKKCAACADIARRVALF